MNTSKVIPTLVNLGCILFVLFTVLPVKLSLSSNVIVGLVVLGVISLFCQNQRTSNKKNVVLAIIPIPFVIYALGLINTSNLDYGLHFLIKNLSFIAIPFVFISMGHYIKKRTLYGAYLIGLGLTNLYLIYLFIYYFNFGTRFYMVVTTDLYHATYLGLYNLLAYWICIQYYRQKCQKVYLYLALFFMISAILSSARIIFVASIFSAIITGVILFTSNAQRLVAVLVTACICVTLIYTVPSIKQKFGQFLEIEKIGFDKSNYQSISSRFGKIEASLKVLSNNLWVGTGTGDLQDKLLEEYKSMGFLMGYKYKYNPHNQFLDNLARNGLIGGTVCLVTIFVWPFYFSLKHRRQLLTAFILTVALISLTESILDVHKGITFYTFFVTLMLYSFSETNKEIKLQ